MSADEMRRAFAAQEQIHRDRQAGMQEMLSELRQSVLASGVDPTLLREFELAAIDMALVDAMERTMEARMKNFEDAAG